MRNHGWQPPFHPRLASASSFLKGVGGVLCRVDEVNHWRD